MCRGVALVDNDDVVVHADESATALSRWYAVPASGYGVSVTGVSVTGVSVTGGLGSVTCSVTCSETGRIQRDIRPSTVARPAP